MEGVIKNALLKKKANLVNKEKGGHALQFQHLILGALLLLLSEVKWS